MSHHLPSLFLLTSLVYGSPVFGGETWPQGPTFQREGNTITLTCEGYASSVEIARRFADQSCIGTLSDQLNSNFKVKTVTVQTEKAVWLNDELTYLQSIKGLQCQLVKEKIEQNGAAYRVLHECRFDIRKAVVNNVPREREPAQISELGEKRIISVASTPRCDSIIITGKTGRAVECKSNPTSFRSESGDETMIVRASGFIPKEVPLKDNGTLEQEYEIFLFK